MNCDFCDHKIYIGHEPYWEIHAEEEEKINICCRICVKEHFPEKFNKTEDKIRSRFEILDL